MAPARKPFSHSRLQTLADCPRRYRFRYVEGLKEAFQSIEAFVGTMVHEVVQWAYVEREKAATPDVEQAVDRYRGAWRRRIGPGVRVVVDGREEGQYLAEGEEMIRRHHATTLAEDRLETIAVEPRIDLSIGPNGYMGFIDRLARGRDGTLHVIDYKTSRSMPRDAASAGLQGRSYGVAVLEKHGGAEVGIRYEYLRHGRAIEEMLPRSRAADVTAAIASRIEAAIAAESSGDFPARPGPLCRWCGFRETCDASGFYAHGGDPLVPPCSVGTPPSHAPPGHAPVARVSSVPPSVVGLAPSSHAPPGGAAAPRATSHGGDGTCPLCGSPVARRTGSKGDMVACSRYPECRHARKV